MSDPHDLRSPYPFRRRVLCPLDQDAIRDATISVVEHFVIKMTLEHINVYSRTIRLCPQGVLSDDTWCIRWCHQPGITRKLAFGAGSMSYPDTAQTSIVIEHPDYPYGVCGDEIETFRSEVRQSYAPMP